MKNLRISLLVLFSLLMFVACDKGEMGPVVSSQPGKPSITAPKESQNYTLTEEAADDTLLTFAWTEPDYGFSAAPSYSIEMAAAENSFEDPVKLATVNKTSFAITVDKMNSTLIANGFPADLSQSFKVRVIASVADSVEKKISDPLSLNMTPYPPFPSIYVSGPYQSASNYDVAPALVSQNRNNTYEGYVYFEEDNSALIFTSQRGSGTSWGDNDNDGTLEENGANIKVSTSGYYRLIVNLNTMSYTLSRTDWGLIGSATANGWSSDQDLTFDKERKKWTITTDLTAGEIKFRANDAWNLDYGDNGGDELLDIGGDNITVNDAGNYTIVLDLGGYYRTYAITQN